MSMGSEKIPEELQKIADNRALILLVELMGFLHDVGKLSSKLYSEHYKRWDTEDSKEYCKKYPKLDELFSKKFGELLKGLVEEEILEKVNDCQIKGFQRHHTGEKHPKEYWPKNWVEEIINLADDKDSSEDRGKAIRKQNEFIASVFGNERNFFDKELEELDNKRKEFWKKLQSSMGKLYGMLLQEKISKEELLEKFTEIYKETKKVIKEYFLNIPAFTIRAGNDVSLFDHSYMTGSIAKSLVVKAILDNNVQERFSQQIIRRDASEILRDRSLPKEEKEIASKTLEKIQALDHFDNECDLDLIIISFDTFSFFSQSQNLLDIEGRKEILRKIREDVKNLIEIEYALGNCIYEDEENLCFLIATINEKSFEFLKEKIYRKFNEKTKGLLLLIVDKKNDLKFYGKALVKLKEKCKKRRDEKFLADGFIPNWIKEWDAKKKDVCILCGKMPQANGKEKDYLCEFCWNVRHKIKWQKEESWDRETSWIDEIADENGKIALIVGKIHPLDEWLNGKFLKYQKIRTKEDLKWHHYAGKYFTDISSEEYVKIRESAITKFTKLLIKIKKHKDELLHKQVKELKDILDDKEATFIGGESKVGEFYYRIGLDKIDTSSEKELKNKVLEAIETKPQSSSRLFRIWRELKKFSELKEIPKEIPKGIRLIFESDELKEKLKDNRRIFIVKQVPEIGEIEVYWDGEKLFTVERIDKISPSDKKVENGILETHKEIADKLNGLKIKITLLKEKPKEKVGKFDVKVEKDEKYERYRQIIASPNGFMLIVPANKALKIVNEISKNFHEEFSKSLGKLSLSIGVVFTQRKMPIFALLEAGRRFLSEFSQLDKDRKVVFPSVENEHLKENEILALNVDGKEIFWKIDTKLGDKESEDKYYPYFILSDGKPIYFDDITSINKLDLYLNRFDFEYLESNIRRFDVVLNENKRRTHSVLGKNGPRPHLLEDLNKIQKLREIFETIGSWTPIRDIEAITIEKREEWSKTYEWEDIRDSYGNFVDAVLENKISNSTKKKLGNWEDNKKFLKECIMEGSFYDAIELFKTIMRIDLRERGGGYGA